jgi:hypothetical protein
MRITLTDVSIRNLKASGTQQSFICNRTPNFGVRVNQAGTKSFFFVVGRERKRVHLGKYPAVSLKEARQAASRLGMDDTGLITVCSAPLVPASRFCPIFAP